ncbi:hypothetical protein [Nocardia asiatica]|uniref:hypothetical protein n=1 Tax=Nocardia asiatica TaxID=209252 RepID=UPI003EE25284
MAKILFDEWTKGHDEFIALVAVGRDRLIRRGTVTPEEATAWVVWDDLTVNWRGTEPISTTPAVNFADALIAILRGTYPEAPAGHQWYFGSYSSSGEMTTVRMAE